MIQCPEWLREKCPCGATCEAGAEFSEDSECAAFAEELGRKPQKQTRYERFRSMSLEEMARLVRSSDADAERYCKGKPECQAALERNDWQGITDEMCLECVREWLMEEI